MEWGRLFCDVFDIETARHLWSFVQISLSSDGSGTRVFWRGAFWVMSWSLRHFVSFRSRATLSRSALFAPVRGQTKLVVWPISSSCQRAFGGVSSMTGGHIWLPPVKMWRQLFHDGAKVEIGRGNDAPRSGNGFALGGSPVAGGRLLFQDHDFLEDFLGRFSRGEI